MDSAAMLSVVIRLVPIHFVAVFFMLFFFGGFAAALSCCIFLKASTQSDTAFIPEVLFFFLGFFCCLLLFFLFYWSWGLEGIETKRCSTPQNALGRLTRKIAWRLIHVHSWKEGCIMVTICATFCCFS